MYEFINEKLQETSLSQSVISGSGPRHMIFSPDGKYCYLVNEISNSIMVYNIMMDTFTFDSSYSLCTSSFSWLFQVLLLFI